METLFRDPLNPPPQYDKVLMVLRGFMQRDALDWAHMLTETREALGQLHDLSWLEIKEYSHQKGVAISLGPPMGPLLKAHIASLCYRVPRG